jgi:hypothetical protein
MIQSEKRFKLSTWLNYDKIHTNRNYLTRIWIRFQFSSQSFSFVFSMVIFHGHWYNITSKQERQIWQITNKIETETEPSTNNSMLVSVNTMSITTALSHNAFTGAQISYRMLA